MIQNNQIALDTLFWGNQELTFGDKGISMGIPHGA